ncbi:MAG: CRISPR system precrRNA processing endoribonuclease RAMP protein Cas6 [bacterium]|nr:CRISPR system precrRNA processing endoribonuclease RAMP protein Cas6 [bacterium]
MQNFDAHRLRFVTTVQTTIELNEHQGSAIRGALFHALRNRFCGNRDAPGCAACPLVATCPVATLVSTLRPGSTRGRDVPRPYTIQPPIGRGEKGRIENGEWRMMEGGRVVFRYQPGERFEFGLTLYAQALQLFPYVVLAAKTFEHEGIGRRMQRDDGRWRRGVLTIQEVWAENPLTGEQHPVMTRDDQMVRVPDAPVTHVQVCQYAGEFITHHASRITLRFLTPARIIERGRLVKPAQFRFQPLFQRLMERLEALSRDFSDTPLHFEDPKALIEAAGRVRLVENHLTWEELRSYSTRRRKESPTSGLLGRVTLEAEDWSPFLVWLAWGQFVHVGKNAVKGNGWYGVE